MPSRVLLLGHRGARGIPGSSENTLAAFDLALASRCDGFEFDVRRTLDGEAVICHDPKYAGLTVRQANAGDLPGICTLETVLARYATGAFLDIELKDPQLGPRTLHNLKTFNVQRDYVVSSFLPAVIEEVHSLDGTTPLGLICENAKQLERYADLPVDWVMPHYTLATPALVHKLQQQGKKLLVWTVNHPAQMTNLVQLGVEGLISDDPALLVKTVRSETSDPAD
jgi:glycerophosphoryl diester phosphodiesterase